MIVCVCGIAARYAVRVASAFDSCVVCNRGGWLREHTHEETAASQTMGTATVAAAALASTNPHNKVPIARFDFNSFNQLAPYGTRKM